MGNSVGNKNGLVILGVVSLIANLLILRNPLMMLAAVVAIGFGLFSGGRAATDDRVADQFLQERALDQEATGRTNAPREDRDGGTSPTPPEESPNGTDADGGLADPSPPGGVERPEE